MLLLCLHGRPITLVTLIPLDRLHPEYCSNVELEPEGSNGHAAPLATERKYGPALLN
jgi:hypothetical protein